MNFVHRSFTGVDDMLVPGTLRGYRTFGLGRRGLDRVSSTGIDDYEWDLLEPAPAECMATERSRWWLSQKTPPTPGRLCPCGCGMPGYFVSGPPREEQGPVAMHAAPHKDCRCGFYGWYDPRDHRMVPASLTAVIEASGRIVLGEHGFRAERARVVAVALPTAGPPYLDPGIRQAQVQVFRTAEEMFEAYPQQDMSELLEHRCTADCRRDDSLEAQLLRMMGLQSYFAPASPQVVVTQQTMRDAQAAAEKFSLALQDLANTITQELTKAFTKVVAPPEPGSRAAALEARRTRNTGPERRERWYRKW